MQGTPRFLGHESLTVTGTATGLTAATFGNADTAVITIEDAPIRFRDDGTDPTSTVGLLAEPGDVIELNSHHQISNFNAIRATTTSASLEVQYGSKAQRSTLTS